APLLVGVDDRFGVGPGPVAMAAALQVAADLAVVVNLAVEDDPDGTVFIRRRLLTGAQIDDAQSAVRQGGVGVEVETRFVRSAVGENVAHADRTRPGVVVDAISCNESGDAAHQAACPFSRRSRSWCSDLNAG